MINPLVIPPAPTVISEDKALLMTHYYRSWESEIGSEKIVNTSYSYLETYDGVPPELMHVLHPEIQLRIEYEALVAKASAAGEAIPPAPIGMGALPIPMPTHPGELPSGASSAAQTRWKLAAETYESAEKAKERAKYRAVVRLDSEDLAAINAVGGHYGLLKVTSAMLWSYMFISLTVYIVHQILFLYITSYHYLLINKYF